MTSKRMNKNYYVKVYGLGLNTLCGYSLAVALLGDALLEKFCQRLDNSGKDKQVCKLRRGLKVTIYVK